METVIIVIHLMVVIALVAVVLLQRSEGGALGIGGGSNFMTTRSTGNVLTRSTAILAAVFFGTSIVLTAIAKIGGQPTSILGGQDPAPAGQSLPPIGGGGGLLDALPPTQLQTPVPATPPAEAPAAPAVPATPAVPTTPGSAPAAPAPEAPPAIPNAP